MRGSRWAMMRAMDGSVALLVPLSGVGVATGLALLWRGLVGYRSAVALGDTATSRIESLAAGEVRVTGTIEAGETVLLSPLQSLPCVWYRARVRTRDGEGGDLFAEECGVGFRVCDGSGTIRVFPRSARVEARARFQANTSGLAEDLPAGYNPRTGSRYATAALEPGADLAELPPEAREAAITALLTVRMPSAADAEAIARPYGAGAREFEEARLEPGDVVTIVGQALPFGHLPDPWGADRMDRASDPLTGLDDPLVAADLAEARAAGAITTPERAWGNAAIEGFGVGRPVRAPVLDPAADVPELAPATAAAEATERFDIALDTLVLAAVGGVPLLIAAGAPDAAVARDQGTFLVGLLGAALAVGSAIVGAAILGGLAA